MTKVYELIFDDYWYGDKHSIALSLDKDKLQKMLDVVAEFDKATEAELNKDLDCGNALTCFKIMERTLI